MKPRGPLLLLLSTLVLAPLTLPAQQLPADDLAHMREELGVNNFTAPSIERVFRQLSALQPLRFEKLWRQPPGETPQSRAQIALLTGSVIADGFLVVSSEKQSRIEPVARALLRLTKGLGIGDRVTKHGQGILELAARERWPDVRRELVHAQADAEAALLALKDEEIAHLIALGGWIRGLEITSAAVADQYTPERAQVLAQPELLDYFTDRMSTLNPALQRTKLIKTLQGNTAKIREILQQAEGKPLSEEQVKAVHERAREMAKALAAHEVNEQ